MIFNTELSTMLINGGNTGINPNDELELQIIRADIDDRKGVMRLRYILYHQDKPVYLCSFDNDIISSTTLRNCYGLRGSLMLQAGQDTIFHDGNISYQVRRTNSVIKVVARAGSNTTEFKYSTLGEECSTTCVRYPLVTPYYNVLMIMSVVGDTLSVYDITELLDVLGVTHLDFQDRVTTTDMDYIVFTYANMIIVLRIGITELHLETVLEEDGDIESVSMTLMDSMTITIGGESYERVAVGSQWI